MFPYLFYKKKQIKTAPDKCLYNVVYNKLKVACQTQSTVFPGIIAIPRLIASL